MIAVPNAPHGRDEIAEAVERQQRGALEGRDEKRARQMRLVMLDVVQLCAQVSLRTPSAGLNSSRRSRTLAALASRSVIR